MQLFTSLFASFDTTVKIPATRSIRVFFSAEKNHKAILEKEFEFSVSDSLTCSHCCTIFADKVEQRNHYKLDWHRHNLKQSLKGLNSVLEEDFDKLNGIVIIFVYSSIAYMIVFLQTTMSLVFRGPNQTHRQTTRKVKLNHIATWN